MGAAASCTVYMCTNTCLQGQCIVVSLRSWISYLSSDLHSFHLIFHQINHCCTCAHSCKDNSLSLELSLLERERTSTVTDSHVPHQRLSILNLVPWLALCVSVGQIIRSCIFRRALAKCAWQY